MDFVSIGLSAILSAGLFVVLEFTVILPLFRRIVVKACDDLVKLQLIPTVNGYIDTKLTDLTANLTKSIWQKIRAMMGGKQKGINSLMAQLQDPEFDIEDLDLDGYQPSTIDKILTIAENLSPILQSPLFSQRRNENGKEKEILDKEDKDKDGVQSSTAQAFKQAQLSERLG